MPKYAGAPRVNFTLGRGKARVINVKINVIIISKTPISASSSSATNGFPTRTYLNRNLPPAVKRNTLYGLQTVDTANAMEVLRRGTDTDSHDPSARFLCDKWNDAERQWHIRTVQIAHHLGGLGLTPQCASGIAAFYHSTARFVGWMAINRWRLLSAG